MTEPEIVVPGGAVIDERIGYGTADGVEYVQSWLVGYAPESGERVFKHEFRLALRGEVEMFGVVAEESAPPSQIEDMAAWVCERAAGKIAEKLSRRSGRLTPEKLADRQNWDARRELAAIWRDYRAWSRKRRAGGGPKLYVPGFSPEPS